MSWTVTRQLSEIRADELGQPGLVFRHDGHRYRSTGRHLAHGGMGTVCLLERSREDPPSPELEQVVGKTFHAQYLYQVRTDEVTRRDYHNTVRAVERIAGIAHPHLLPIHLSAPIADNHLLVAPRQHETLLEAIARGKLTHRRRVKLLMQALDGMGALHAHRIIHRDLTLRNILLDRDCHHALLFDFDLALCLDDIGAATYRSHYQGRIFGSPGYSVAPEVVDVALAESAITPRLDIYAIGGAIFSLFTDALPYGTTEDMWSLLVRIGEGVVFAGDSRITYPESVPSAVRPVIEGCLERDPGNRFGSVSLVVDALRQTLRDLDDGGRKDSFTWDTRVRARAIDTKSRVKSVHLAAGDLSVDERLIERIDRGLAGFGYQIQRSLGRVKGHPIFVAAPNPDWLLTGQFPDSNTYPKIVTAVDLSAVADPHALLDAWFSRYLPVLMTVREGLLTSLYKVVYEQDSHHILIFSEFVDDARFGTDLEHHRLTLKEALALAFLVVQQVGRLHEHGLAHNNVRPESLLLKGVRDSQSVHPAMVGLVTPSESPAAMTEDVRNLAGMVVSWIRPARIEALEARLRPRIEALRSRLFTIAFDTGASPPAIDELFAWVAEGWATVDYNFGVLRQHGGDLQGYALLQVSHPMYGRLWR